VYNVGPYQSEIKHAKSSKSPRMFQRYAVDTGPDLGSQNVLKIFELVEMIMILLVWQPIGWISYKQSTL